MTFVNICRFVDLGSIQYRGGVVEFFLTFEFNYIIIHIQLCMVAASSSSSEEDVSLGVSQEEAPTPPAPSTDATSYRTGSQRRGGVPSHRNQFTRKYEAQWKDAISM